MVHALTTSLTDDVLYVRVCAAAALGDIGPGAAGAADALEKASTDPGVRAEARRALARINGVGADAPPARASRQPLAEAPVQQPQQPQLSSTRADGDPPLDWDIETGRNVAWSVPLGGDAFGRPVVADGVVYVGTDNALQRDPRFPDPCGVLAAFRASDGTFLWQDLAPRVDRGLGEFLLPSTTSAPYVEGGRLYYVTAECQLRCLDVSGGADPPRVGARPVRPARRLPARIVQQRRAPPGRPADRLDFQRAEPGAHARPLAAGAEPRRGRQADRRGRLAGGRRRRARAARAVVQPGRDQRRGADAGPLRRRRRVAPAYEPRTGEESWRFDGNPKDARSLAAPGVLSRGAIIASPVYGDGRVFIAMGDDPSHGDGPSLLHALRPSDAAGDVTDTHRLWTSRDVGRVVGAPVVDGGLLYVGDLGGRLTCLDAATGSRSSGGTTPGLPSGAACYSRPGGCTSATSTGS